MNPIVFCFRVKFYCADPTRLKEVTRYYLYSQLRRDLLHGRLCCSSNETATLMAYVVQSELGDYDPKDHGENYLASFKLVQNQTPKLEKSVMEIHQKEMKGLAPADAELNFLKKAAQLDTYGIDPHSVKDHKGVQLYLGINYSGIITFQGNRKNHHFKWNEIQKITYEGKMFIVHLLLNDKKHLMGFKCPNVSSCHFLWRCAVEQRYFFTMNSSKDVPFVTTGGGLFFKTCKLRYSGRVEREIINDMKNNDRKTTTLQRSYSTTSAPTNMRALTLSNSTPLKLLQNDTIQESSTNDTLSQEKTVQRSNEPCSLEHCENRVIIHDTTNPPHNLDPFDEDDWDMSLTSSLPTEFDLRPDITPTDEEVQSIAFETPAVRSSPSHNPNEPEILEESDKDESRKHSTQKRPQSLLYVIIRTSVLSSILLLLFFSCLVVLIIESESDLLSSLRKLPEMVILRRDYYEPIKNSILHGVAR